MFDPTLGRWIEEDPEGFSAGDTNLYRYVGDNPTDETDPSGMQAVGTAKPPPKPSDVVGTDKPSPSGPLPNSEPPKLPPGLLPVEGITQGVTQSGSSSFGKSVDLAAPSGGAVESLPQPAPAQPDDVLPMPRVLPDDVLPMPRELPAAPISTPECTGPRLVSPPNVCFSVDRSNDTDVLGHGTQIADIIGPPPAQPPRPPKP
jgi:hypothetical protein